MGAGRCGNAGETGNRGKPKNRLNLSIVIPTFNRRDSLAVTLRALARQDYDHDKFETLVVSDGSDDGTDEMAAELAGQLAIGLRYYRQRNAGPAAARNRGIREARFPVIVFLDDDVEPCATFLAAHARRHEADDRLAVIGPMLPDPSSSPDEPVWIAWEHAQIQRIYDFFRPGGEYYGTPVGPMHFYSGNASVRREWLLFAGGFNETFGRQEDVELAGRLERDCGIRFDIDFECSGLHRPRRTFESWLRIPGSYGALDARRTEAGTDDRAYIEAQLAKKNPATRALGVFAAAIPGARSGLTALLRWAAEGLYRSGRKRAALSALSALYNMRYYCAWRNELITAGRTRPGKSQETT